MEISEWRQCQFVDCEYSTSVEFSLFHISERHGSLLDGDIGVAPNRSQCHSAECGYSTSVECGRPIFSLLHTSTQFLSDCICGFTTPTVSSNPAPNIHHHSFTLPLTHFRSDCIYGLTSPTGFASSNADPNIGQSENIDENI